MDDREESVIEDEMDGLRVGGYSFIGQSVGEFCLSQKTKQKSAYKGIISVIGVINPESSHPFPQAERGIKEAKSTEGR
jgi:hypothetical protein